MYFSTQEIIDRYVELQEDHRRRLELENIRLDNEIKELKRKATISRLVDTQGRFPWEEDYE